MTAVQDIERAIDQWVLAQGAEIKRQDHTSLAKAIREALEGRLRGRAAKKALLVDIDADGDYCNPRLADFDGAEETMYPIDPETGEPVEEPVAHYVLTLPHPDDVPEI